MMGVLRFKAKSSYKSVLKLSALSVMVAVLSGCGKDSNNDSSSFLATIWNKNNTAQVVLTGTAIDDPIFNGTVRVMTPDGVEIGKATTKVDGTFSVSVAESFLSAPILLQVSGGTMAGQPFTGTLKAIYTSQDGRTGLNLTPVTTLVSHLANAEGGSDLAAKRNTVLNKLTALGMVDLQSWRKVTDTPFDLGTIAFRISDLGGVTPWLNTIQTDIADGELSKNEMMMGFPKAHGGVQGVSVEGNGNIAAVAGDSRLIDLDYEGVSAENTTFTVILSNAPSWVYVNAKKQIQYTVPDNITADTTFEFTVSVTANGVSVGRSEVVRLNVLPTITLIDGVIPVAGGKLESQWKDIAITAAPDILPATTQFKTLLARTKQGGLLIRHRTVPALSDTTFAKLNILLDDPENLLLNYFPVQPQTATERSIQPKSTGSGITGNIPFNGSTSNTSACLTDVSEYLRGPGPGVFKQVIKTKHDLYDGKHRVTNKANKSELKCASRLWEPTVSTGDPVLFVHGFIRSGELGGFDDEAYFGNFPALAQQAGYRPYLFEWRTWASFNDVATELGDAIKLINEKTGKKVHIVGHSFGGLLSRTLMQNLAYSLTEGAFHSEYTRPISPTFSERSIATLTTVGTPHSGISDENTKGLPNGVDGSAGNAIDFFAWLGGCNAKSCTQAGSTVSGDGGQLILDLQNAIYPNIPTQVLIGLGGSNKGILPYGAAETEGQDGNMGVTCNLNSSSDYTKKCQLFFTKKKSLDNQGDGLISFYGQRFYPDTRGRGSPLRTLTDGNGNIQEHILDFNASGDVGKIDTYFQSSGSPEFWADLEIPHAGFNTTTVRRQDQQVYTIFYAKTSMRITPNSGVGVYNHRTGQYRDSLKMSYSSEYKNSNIFPTDYPLYIPQFSEVGLQNCDSNQPNSCNHATWKYFKKFLEVPAHKAGDVAPANKVSSTGQLNFPTTATARAVGGAIPTGTWVRIYTKGNELVQADLAADGSFNTPVDFSPNTNYILRIHAPGYRAKFINGEDFGATTGATVAESSLNFGVIEMETLPFAAGDMKVVVTNAVTGRSVTGYKVTAYNSVNNITGKKEEADTMANPTPTLTTLAKGYHRLEVSKDGYEIAKQMCYAKENQLTTCQINIVPKASVSAGQLLSVLRWDVNPRDLDSHLFKYDANGNRVYQIYYANQVSGADSLDVDDRDSYGPETVTIDKLDPKANYVYAIHHFAGSGSITTTSQAQVSVLQNGKPVRIYKAPLAGFGGWWKVFEIKNGQVIPCQQDCMFSTAPQPTARSIALPTPRWLLDAMSAPMPPKK